MSDEQKPGIEAEKPEVNETNVNNYSGKPKPPTTPEDLKKVNGLGWALLLMPILIIFFLVILWPSTEPFVKPGEPTKPLATPTPTATPTDSPKEASADNSKTPVVWSKQTNLIKFDISFQLRMLLLVLLAGALGSYIHMAASFSFYLGIDQFDLNWFWWYLLRIPIGAVLATIFSLLIQGELLTLPVGSPQSRLVAIIGLAALIGMFSRQATEKLQEIFDTVFNSKQGSDNKERQEKINKGS